MNTSLQDLGLWLEELESHQDLRTLVCRVLVGLRDTFGCDFTALALDVPGSATLETPVRAYCPSRETATPVAVGDDSVQPEVLFGVGLAKDFWGRQEDRVSISLIAEERVRLLDDGTTLIHLRFRGGSGVLLVGPRPDRTPLLGESKAMLDLCSLHLAVLLDRVRLREELEHDPISGALSRQAIFSNLKAVLEEASIEDQPLTIGILELDRLEEVHDTIGHPAGEKLMRTVSQAIKALLRPTDWLGRYGGEEFLLVLPGTRMGEASDFVKSICKEIRSLPVEVGTSEAINTTLSVGLLALEYGGTTAMAKSRIEDLVAVADFALLQAKRKGGDTIHKWSWRHTQPLGTGGRSLAG